MKVIGSVMGELLGTGLPAGGAAPPQVSAVDVVRFQHARDLAIVAADRALDGFDAFLSPVTITPAFVHSEPKSPIPVDGEDVESRFVDHYLYPWSMLGHPNVVIPAGLSDEGLPIGVQLTGHRWQDEELLAVATNVSEAIGGYRPPPLAA
jgi:amidase